MVKIKLQDMSFYGDSCSSKYHKSRNIEWDRTPGGGPLVFFTDSCLNMATMPCYKKSFKIAWLIEPPVIRTDSYQYALSNLDKFDLVLTHQSELLKISEKICYYPACMSWVAIEDWKEYPKTKGISIIASEKNYAPGHQLRHELIKKVGGKVDVFGRGYNPVEHKIEALKDYRFSIAIENCRNNHYFTEKLIDCFATWTIPIYWGCPEIARFFDPDGIIQCDSLDSLVSQIELVSNDTGEAYNMVASSVKKNFDVALDYTNSEDWIFDHILKPKGLV